MTVVAAAVLFPFFAAVTALLISSLRSLVLPLGLLPSLILALADGGRFFHGTVLRLEGPLGVALLPDETARLMILLSGLVGLGIWVWMRRNRRVTSRFCPLALLLVGSCNAVFISYDLFNLYVGIELVTVLGFLLIRLEGGARQIWTAVKYLLLGNLGMTLFLLAVLRVYTVTGDLRLSAAGEVTLPVVMLLVGGLAVKGGLFVLGLWLPEAHGGAPSPVSALLSGVVVLTGVIPILRLAAVCLNLPPVVQMTGGLSVVLGIVLALRERDVKRLLACSTLSQLGYVLLCPAAGVYFALGHGLVKAWLFLAAGDLPDKRIDRLRSMGLSLPDRLAFALPCLVLAGLPGFTVWSAKALILGQAGVLIAGFVKVTSLLTAFYLLRPVTGRFAWGEPVPLRWPPFGVLFFIIALTTTAFSVPSSSLPTLMPLVTLVIGGAAARRMPFHPALSVLPPWERLDHLMGCAVAATLILYLTGGMLS